MSNSPKKPSRMVVTEEGIKFLISSLKKKQEESNPQKIKIKIKSLKTKEFTENSKSPKKKFSLLDKVKKRFKPTSQSQMTSPNVTKVKNTKLKLFATNAFQLNLPPSPNKFAMRHSAFSHRKTRFHNIFSPMNRKPTVTINPLLFQSNDKNTKLKSIYAKKEEEYEQEMEEIRKIRKCRSDKKMKDKGRGKFLQKLSSNRLLFTGYYNNRTKKQLKLRDRLFDKQEKIFENIRKIVKRNKIKEKEDRKKEERKKREYGFNIFSSYS